MPGRHTAERDTGRSRGGNARVSNRSLVVAVKDQVSCKLDESVAILGLKNGMYYGLDAVGVRIWELIQQPLLVSDIHAALLRQYDVPPDRCEKDLLALLGELIDEGLVEVREP